MQHTISDGLREYHGGEISDVCIEVGIGYPFSFDHGGQRTRVQFHRRRPKGVDLSKRQVIGSKENY